MKENIIQQKSYNFALKIVTLYRTLNVNSGERILLNQLLRCGTSIGANIEEAEGAVSKKEFMSKMAIAFKEARECQYWLRLLFDSKILSQELNVSILSECVEILKILNSIIKSSKIPESATKFE